MPVKSIILAILLTLSYTAAWGESSTPAAPSAVQNCVPSMTVEKLEMVFAEAAAAVDRNQEGDAGLACILMRDCLMYRRGADAEERRVLAEAVITLWHGGHGDTLQLAWWRSRSSYARLLILAVELGACTQEGLHTSGSPYFDPNRYTEAEREIRLGELRWVLDNHAAIHAMLGRLDLLPSSAK